MNQIVEVARKEIIVSKSACSLFGVSTFVLLTAVSAYVRIPLPFTPVPVTLQTFFVLLSGAFLGSGLGAVSQVGYLVLGIIGLPLFTGGGSGIFHLMGPTGGYLIGFVVASWVVGKLIHLSAFFSPEKKEGKSEKNVGFLWIVLSLVIGSLFIYLFGFLQLAFLTGLNLPKAFIIGVLPFIPLDVLKLLLAASLYEKYQVRVKSIFSQ